MARILRVLTCVGAVLLIGAAAYADFYAGFLCYDLCPPESGLADALALRFAQTAWLLLPGTLLLGCTWVICLTRLARVRRWPWFVAVLLALPFTLALAAVFVLHATGGYLLPITWLQHGYWSSAVDLAVLLLLIWPVTILLASYAIAPRNARSG
jgi:hypothetical protein